MSGRVEGRGCEEPRHGAGAQSLFLRAIRSYGRHKSAGIDNIHITLLYALSTTTPVFQPPEKATSSSSSLNPLASPFIATQPVSPSLPPNPFAPPPPRAPPPPPPKPSLPRILSSLFRLALACGCTPRRWGETTVTLISKLKDKKLDPTPSQTRPIALLPMFRRLFEILLLPTLSPSSDSSWTSLHPHQAGFRSGWSCDSSVLIVDHLLSRTHPLAAFLDFASAYDSPPPHLILRSLRHRQAPLVIRAIVWSLLTSGSFRLVVNGALSPAQPRRRGFPQGGPSSPLLFNLYVDSLLHELNALSSSPSFAYADDLASLASTVPALQLSLDRTHQWSSRWGMHLNVRKCAILAPPHLISAASTLRIGDEPVPVVSSFRYLGVPVASSGIDALAFLSRKADTLQRSLRAVQAAASAFPPLARLRLFTTFSLSHLNYGGAILSLALSREPALQASPEFRRIEVFHQEAVRWITGVSLPRLWALASSMAALAPPLLRLEQLSLGLALHVNAAPPSNPSHALFTRFRDNLDPSLLQPTPPRNTPFLAMLAFLPIHLAFSAQREEQARLHLPLISRHTFVRQTTLLHFDRHSSRLATYVRPSCRLRGTVDGAIALGTDEDRKRAVRWRSGTFGIRWKCLHCGRKFTRGCAAHMRYAVGLYNEEGKVEEAELKGIFDEAQAWRQERALTDGWGGSFDGLDLLVGNRKTELAAVGLATLREWESRMLAFSSR